MKKIFAVLLGMAMLSMGATQTLAADAAAVPTGNPIEQLTGEIWMNSSSDIKKALLFGVDCAISIEHAVAERLQEVNKADRRKKATAPVSTLSPFEQGWSKAFKNVPRGEIVENIDTWYAENPDKKQRPVFDVIWYELVMPKTK